MMKTAGQEIRAEALTAAARVMARRIPTDGLEDDVAATLTVAAFFARWIETGEPALDGDDS